MTLIAQINGTAAFVASVNGSTPFNITAATSSEFVASMAAIGPQGPSGVATATFPVIYTSETQNISIEPNYFALVSALDDYLLITDAAITYQTIAGMNVYLTAATAASTYYLQTNPSGFITSAALTPYLLSATAATTYYLQTNPSGFITAAALTGYATEAFVTSQGYITSAALTPYLTSADAATTYYLQTNPAGFITSAALSGYATETWVGEQGFLTAPYNPFDQTLNTTDTVQFAEVRTDTVRPKSLNANLNLTVYNDTGIGVYYTNYFDAFTNKLVFDTDAGGITFPDGTSQTTAWTGSYNPFDQTLNTTDIVNFQSVEVGTIGGDKVAIGTQVTVLDLSGGGGSPVRAELTKNGLFLSNAGAGITFPDGTIQTTAADGGDFLPLAGGTMTGAILFGTAGQNIDVGSFDNGTGGANGISLNCAVNYELNWQGGFLENRYSGTAYPIGLNSNLIFGTIGSGIYTEISSNGFVWTTVDTSAYGEYTKQRFNIGGLGVLNPVWIDASLNMGTGGNPSIQIQPDGASGDAMKIDGFGLTFPDATVQTTAYTGPTNPFDQSLNTTDTPTFVSVNLVSGVDSGSLTPTSLDLGSLSINAAGTGINLGAGSGLSITFPDTSIQTTAFPPAGGTTLQYIDGTGALQTFPTGGTATKLQTTVYNNSGVTISAFHLVYINGRHGNDPTIALAQANAEVTSRGTFGFTTTNIADHALGTVIQVGLLEGVNTNAYAEGALLFLSPTVAGHFTDVQPSSPNHYVNVGTVIRSHPTQGTIQVRIINSNELNELSDVQVNSSVSGDILVKNGSGYWVSNSKNTAGVVNVTSSIVSFINDGLSNADAPSSTNPFATEGFTNSAVSAYAASVTPLLPTADQKAALTAAETPSSSNAIITESAMTTYVTDYVATSIPSASTSTIGVVQLDTRAEGIAGTNTAKAMTADAVNANINKTSRLALGAAVWSSATSGTGASGGQIFNAKNPTAPTTAIGYGTTYYSLLLTNGSTGGYNTAINWSKRNEFTFQYIKGVNTTDVNTVARLVIGKPSFSGVAGDPTTRSVGVRNYGTGFLELIVHDGTTLTAIATTIAVNSTFILDLRIVSEGNGTVTLYNQDTQVATTSSGPTVSTGSSNNVILEAQNLAIISTTRMQIVCANFTADFGK